jgi:hypothetical protein
MIVTPSANSSFLAGIGLWAVGWASVFKLDRIPLVKRFMPTSRKDAMLDWMGQNKVVTLLGTEALNFGVHGISQPAAVTFALGGTFFNLIMIFVYLPIRTMRRAKAKRQEILQGVAS